MDYGYLEYTEDDLLRDLGRLMAAPVCQSGSKFESNGRCNVDDGVTAPDRLDLIRSDAHEDFRNNGVDVELDDLDKYQSHLRERTTSETLALDQNPVLAEFLKMKERRKNKKAKRVCVFCKNNGEQANVYQGHVLKDAQGRTSCPILRRYTCPLCGAAGDNAHTIRYCPRNEGDTSTVVGLLKTNRLSTGKKRKC